MERNNVSASLSCVYPFDLFLYLSFNLQSLLSFWIPIYYISIHLNPTLIHIYPFLSSTYLHLSLSIFCLSTLILFYRFFNLFNYPNLFESQSLYPILGLAYPCLSFSILFQSRILFIFLNLYLLNHINTFLSFLQYKSALPLWIPVSLSKSIPSLSTSIFFYSLAI